MKPLLFIALMVFASCASAPALIESRTTAFVRGTWKGHHAYYVGRFDSVSVSRPVLPKDWARPRAVPEGERQLTVYYEEVDSTFPSRPRGAYVTLRAKLQQGVVYAPDGRDDGRSVAIWIKRVDSGDRVSEVATATKEERPPAKAAEAPFRPDYGVTANQHTGIPPR